MNSPTNVTPTPAAERFLKELAESLEIPRRVYELVDARYKAVGAWMERTASKFNGFECDTYAQGSFSLGTVIRPLTPEEEYDLDIAFCANVSKQVISQKTYKEWVGLEMTAYAKAHNMKSIEEKQRCWRLHYAEEAQFHMDVVPAVPDALRQRQLFEAVGVTNAWVDNAVAITDTQHEAYPVVSDNWPLSNPRGYVLWFRSQMQVLFEQRRRGLMLAEGKVNMEEIPSYRVKTPLQSAIQILKRHRDVRFDGEPDDKPISIILTTLAARAYNQEVTIAGALYSILDRMDSSEFITKQAGETWIENPTNRLENFADKWKAHPERERAFHDWLAMARADFRAAADLTDYAALIDALAPRIGRPLLEEMARTRLGQTGLLVERAGTTAKLPAKVRSILDAPHREPLRWPQFAQGMVQINRAEVTRDGWRPYDIASDGQALPKECALRFEARSNVSDPFQVYWQVVNMGSESRAAKNRRGGFDQGFREGGKLIRKEKSLYHGTHSIECFIVNDGYCVARSGPFLVNVL